MHIQEELCIRCKHVNILVDGKNRNTILVPVILDIAGSEVPVQRELF